VLVLQVNNMSLEENVDNDRLRFVLTDKTALSTLQLVCQAPNDEVRQNWVTQIRSLLDMQGDLLLGKFSHMFTSFLGLSYCSCK